MSKQAQCKLFLEGGLAIISENGPDELQNKLQGSGNFFKINHGGTVSIINKKYLMVIEELSSIVPAIIKPPGKI